MKCSSKIWWLKLRLLVNWKRLIIQVKGTLSKCSFGCPLLTKDQI